MLDFFFLECIVFIRNDFDSVNSLTAKWRPVEKCHSTKKFEKWT